MNDRFKFRAWDKKYGLMLHFHTPSFCMEYARLDFEMDDGDYDEAEERNIRWCIDESDWQLMQSTGLKDKNGKLIYEGDIVKCDEVAVEVVEYRDAGFRFKSTEGLVLGQHNADLGLFEVIGNIYEHPNLLKND